MTAIDGWGLKEGARGLRGNGVVGVGGQDAGGVSIVVVVVVVACRLSSVRLSRLAAQDTARAVSSMQSSSASVVRMFRPHSRHRRKAPRAGPSRLTTKEINRREPWPERLAHCAGRHEVDDPCASDEMVVCPGV